jgi:hypothetical protein
MKLAVVWVFALFSVVEAIALMMKAASTPEMTINL